MYTFEFYLHNTNIHIYIYIVYIYIYINSFIFILYNPTRFFWAKTSRLRPWRRLLHPDVKAIVVGTNGYDAPGSTRGGSTKHVAFKTPVFRDMFLLKAGFLVSPVKRWEKPGKQQVLEQKSLGLGGFQSGHVDVSCFQHDSRCICQDMLEIDDEFIGNSQSTASQLMDNYFLTWPMDPEKKFEPYFPY